MMDRDTLREMTGNKENPKKVERKGRREDGKQKKGVATKMERKREMKVERKGKREEEKED